MDKGNKKEDFRDNAAALAPPSGKLDVTDIVLALAHEIDQISPQLPLEVRTNALGRAATIARETLALQEPSDGGSALSVAFAEVRGAPYGVVNLMFDSSGNVMLTEAAPPGSSEADRMLDIHRRANPEAFQASYRSMVIGQNIPVSEGPTM